MITISLGTALLLIMLTGCGTTTSDTTQADTTTDTTAAATDTSSTESTGDTNTQGTMLLGKVKSIDGNTLTIYTASMQPGDGGAMNGGQPPQGEVPQGEAPQGNPPADGDTSTPPAQGDTSDGSAPEQPQDGTEPPSMDNLFTEETMEITITDSTTMPTEELKADDIVNITLEEGTQNALSIQVSGQGMNPPQGNTESTTESSADDTATE